MTPEEKRIAAAEACGWRYIPSASAGTSLPPHGSKAPLRSIVPLPDYLQDLDACREMEEHVSGEPLRTKYLDALYDLTKNQPDPSWALARSTAPQRVDAFLKALGLLKE